MPIIQVIIIIIVVGVLVWLADFIPMDATIRKILRAVIIIVLVLWILGLFVDFGSLGMIGTHRIGK